MDGVLADFDAGFKKIFGVYPQELRDSCLEDFKIRGIDDKAAKIMFKHIFWQSIKEHGKGKDFWINLPPMKGFFHLNNYLKNLKNVIICTLAPDVEYAFQDAVDGKIAWLKKYEVLTTTIIEKLHPVDHNIDIKSKFCETKRDILIDDNLNYVEAWRKKGGIAIHHTDAKRTIDLLKPAIDK